MSSLTLVTCFILLNFIVIIVNEGLASPLLLKTNCSNANFTPDSSYDRNVGNLLSSLTTKTTQSFSEIAVGSNGNIKSDMVYGQFLCQGDYNLDDCRNYVAKATRFLAIDCPTSMSGFIFYEGCSIYYSNVKFHFHGVYNDSSNSSLYIRTNEKATAPNVIEPIAKFLDATIKELVNQVAGIDEDVDTIQTFSPRSKYFGTKEVHFTTFTYSTTLYVMVQCTPDLSVRDCHSCLMVAINKFLNHSRGWLGSLVVNPTCLIRYETYPFYKLTQDIDSLATFPQASSNAEHLDEGNMKMKVLMAIVVPVSILLALGVIGVGFCINKPAKEKFLQLEMEDFNFEAIESLQYHLHDLKAATNDFSDNNKIGEGGFGKVYKGVLPSGQLIAVKRLFEGTWQMERDFRNEVQVVAKLQHRNLVRLLGFCLEKHEKLLVFEYVPNKSLDKVLFDIDPEEQLDWLVRFKIIVGIARGLLYLHEESRLRIIHRDLKPGNILLDDEMNPKIADFGMARIFGLKPLQEAAINMTTWKTSDVDTTHQSTRRTGGTPGYMAPECAERRHFSLKSDVYSFGILMLEIVCGKRNSRFHLTGLADDLLSYVSTCWTRWAAGTTMELLDVRIGSETILNEEMKNQVLTCIHLGLLCVQRDAKRRPTMGTITHMLNFPCAKPLPLPQPPVSSSSTTSINGATSSMSSSSNSMFHH